VQLREATSDVQVEALLNDEIDAGLVIPPRGAKFQSTISYMPVVRERLMLALPEEWMSRRRVRKTMDKIDLKDIVDEPLIIFPRASSPSFHDTITDYCEAQRVTPKFGQVAIQMQTIVSLVSAGMGFALVPESLKNLRRTGVVYCELKGAGANVETGLIWRREQVSSALKGFIKCARGLGGQL
jgi:DNA-binding transcriptional LysR family regulator